ncbi:DNA repair protein RecN [Gammaproteobacteria bacterium]
MLVRIQILNYAIVDYLDLEFAPNMTVLTGETGAGKSILVDALGLALGDRADSGTIRQGAERAEVSAIFALTNLPAVRANITEHALDENGEDGESEKECLLRRVLGKDGRSRAFINGRTVPLQSLRELGGLLVDIHGQHDHQSLLVRDIQRQILDDYTGNTALLATVAERYRQLHRLATEYERIRQAAADRENRLDYLRFQLQELDDLALQGGELEVLEEEHRWLAHATRLLEGGQAALARLQGDGVPSALALLSRARNELRPLQGVDARLTPATELLEGAVIQVEEAAAGLRHYLSSLDLDPQRLDFVEGRLAAVMELSRKHRVEPMELSALMARLRGEAAELERSEIRAEELAAEVETARRAYQEVAAILHAARIRVGTELAGRVTENIRALGMPGGRFEVACTLLEDQAGPNGTDRVEFLVSTNPGSPARPLSKVVSGGELSRISLALQVLVATNLRVPTLVFDEVDVGIGGRVAGIVGRLLHHLGEQRQVLCVTHLPQVAAEGHHHLLVTKHTDGITTRTNIRPLESDERVQEIARMLGGVELTDQTRAHAQEMVNLAQQT